MARITYVYVLRHDTKIEILGTFRHVISAMPRAEELGFHEKGRSWHVNKERTIYSNNEGQSCDFPVVIEKRPLEP
jgi:hypothetical protein